MITSAQETACRLLCAAGLAEMQNRKYKNAARLFSKATFEHCNFPDVSVFKSVVITVIEPLCLNIGTFTLGIKLCN